MSQEGLHFLLDPLDHPVADYVIVLHNERIQWQDLHFDWTDGPCVVTRFGLKIAEKLLLVFGILKEIQTAATNDSIQC